jgi:phosphate starvation-inducible PhoH-like protein
MSRKRKQSRQNKPGAMHFQYPTAEMHDPMVARGYKTERLVALTANQREYMRAVKNNDVVIAYGPPGTGKTHIAMGLAVQMIRAKEIEKIIVTRPVVPVGRDIGYLPGGIEEKLGPYLRPLFDELEVYCEKSLLKIWMDTGKLEICPISAMRGRTFRNACVVLDEAQNATFEELRMFFTRFGSGSKVIATGDPNQSDLPRGMRGGFSHAIDILNGVEGLQIMELLGCDIVRHAMTSEIDSRFARREACNSAV